MTEEKSITLSSGGALQIQAAFERYNILVEYVRKMMTVDRDYGKIPGSDKPTLLKPGAEKLMSLFQLYPVWKQVEVITDFTNGLFFYQYECSLVHRQTGETWGTGLGSCNSKESKYRYRYVETDKKPSKEEAAELKAKGVGRWRKDFKGGWIWTERVENDQIYDIVNTIDKMAQKRALVAATLIACNASEFFTQDMEDIGFVEGTYTEVEPVAPAPEPVQAPTLAPIVYDYSALDPAILEMTNQDGEKYIILPSDKLSGMVNTMLRRLDKNELSDDDKERINAKITAARAILATRGAQHSRSEH